MTVLHAEIQVAGVHAICTRTIQSLHQGVDYEGRPNTVVHAGLLKYTFTGEEALNDKWVELAIDSYRRESGHSISFNEEGSTFRRLTFYDAYCVHYELRFDARGQNGKSSLETEIHFSAAAVEFDGAHVENHSRLWWEKKHVTRFNALTKPVALVPSPSLRAVSTSIISTPQSDADWQLDKVSKLNQVADHRIQDGLPDFAHSPGTTGTVAYTRIKKTDYYGYNSKIDDFNPRLDGRKRYTLSIEERREWFSKLKEKGKLSDLSDLSRAQFLSHAEAENLIKAAKNDKLPKVIDMYVDRVTCPSCRKYLPALLDELGVDTLNVFYKIKDHPGFTHLPINKP